MNEYYGNNSLTPNETHFAEISLILKHRSPAIVFMFFLNWLPWLGPGNAMSSLDLDTWIRLNPDLLSKNLAHEQL